MEVKNYDPVLRQAMLEIEQVLKKHDIGGFVALSSKTHAEFKMAYNSPTWSNVRFVDDGEVVHLKFHIESDKENTNSTVAMLCNLRDLCVLGFGETDEIIKHIEKHVEIKHKPFGPNGISNEDRSSKKT